MSSLQRVFWGLLPFGSPPLGFGAAIANKSTGLRGAIAGCALLGLTGANWCSLTAVAPPAAIAYSSRASVSLVRQGEETYETFMRRAEAIARAAVQRRFDSDILVTDVSITILGQNNGAVLPVLILNVSRNDWRRQPDPQRWAKYFRNAPLLLGFEPPPTAQPETPPPPPPVEPVAPSELPPAEGEAAPLPTLEPSPANPNSAPRTAPANPNSAPGTAPANPNPAPGTNPANPRPSTPNPAGNNNPR